MLWSKTFQCEIFCQMCRTWTVFELSLVIFWSSQCRTQKLSTVMKAVAVSPPRYVSCKRLKAIPYVTNSKKCDKSDNRDINVDSPDKCITGSEFINNFVAECNALLVDRLAKLLPLWTAIITQDKSWVAISSYSKEYFQEVKQKKKIRHTSRQFFCDTYLITCRNHKYHPRFVSG